MKQPSLPNKTANSSPSSSMETVSAPLIKKQMGQKRKLPTAQELITHYESKGIDSKEAASKVIDDLQRALFKVVTSRKKDATPNDFSTKLDLINARLVRLETKVDTKPGFGQSLAIGLASGAALSGLGNVLPHVCHAVGQMWSTVRSNSSGS
ncbi:uncharacterized protein LOC124940051 [Impatiens glandulifera]|uniref:uncharacterized protein LOC124940051 n=1 Tax=Impatiens glandulifera TaxID=253017 RepID=UPI001FB1930F|nr:uncharacterized protein LOC124940051 [Impatiens glandulifera]